MLQTVHLIAAARPNFMKVAPLWHALKGSSDFGPVLIHTGQHYDANMSDAIFTDLGLPRPDFHLGVGSGTHAQQTGGVMIAYEKILEAGRPHWIVVVGDVNSTAACAMVGAKERIPVVHLEAGLRSGDRSMPEEINRLVTDAISDVLWTPSPDADANLLREGVAAAAISRVGNIMIDSYVMVQDAIVRAGMPTALGLRPGEYGVVTLHRPSNVDSPAHLRTLVDALIAAAARLTLVFPVHPRTRSRLEAAGWLGELEAAGLLMLKPQPYIKFMSLVSHAAIAITDSGGIQEETTYLGIPCLTLRENTERHITISEGTNRLIAVGELGAALDQCLSRTPIRRVPERWDGQTAARCVEDLRRRSLVRCDSQ